MHSSLHLYLQSLQLRLHSLLHRLPQHTEIPFAIFAANVAEPQKVERLRLACVSPCSICGRIPSKLIQPGFLALQFQVELLQPFCQLFFESLRFGLIFEAHHKVSGPRESHPRALSEPDVNLSAHPAPVIQPRAEFPSASEQTIQVYSSPVCPSNGWLWFCAALISCTSAAPRVSAHH